MYDLYPVYVVIETYFLQTQAHLMMCQAHALYPQNGFLSPPLKCMEYTVLIR